MSRVELHPFWKVLNDLRQRANDLLPDEQPLIGQALSAFRHMQQGLPIGCMVQGSGSQVRAFLRYGPWRALVAACSEESPLCFDPEVGLATLLSVAKGPELPLFVIGDTLAFLEASQGIASKAHAQAYSDFITTVSNFPIPVYEP